MNAETNMVSIEEARAYLKTQGFVYAHPDYVAMVRRELWLKQEKEKLISATALPVDCK
jgi:hypothetical protein